MLEVKEDGCKHTDIMECFHNVCWAYKQLSPACLRACHDPTIEHNYCHGYSTGRDLCQCICHSYARKASQKCKCHVDILMDQGCQCGGD